MADETIATVNETPVDVKAAEPMATAKKTRAPRKKGEPKPAKPAATPAFRAFPFHIGSYPRELK
jgi:putative transposase